MTSILIVVLLLVVLAAIGAVAAVAFGARAIGRNATRDLALVPGVPSRVPASWAGSHDPEARLYRRLRDAVRGAQDSDAHYLGDGGASVELEQQALRVEEQLVALTRIAPHMRKVVLDQLEETVTRIEHLCADHVSRQAGWGSPEMVRELDAMSERLDLIAQARAELETNPGQQAQQSYPQQSYPQQPPSQEPGSGPSGAG